MKYRELEESALKLNELYEALEMKLYGRVWTTEELALGFVGDIGDLAKLVQANAGIRKIDNFKSKLGIRLVKSSSASSIGLPRFCSSKVRLNSPPMGSEVSCATKLKPAAKLWPARNARAISSNASGNWEANFAKRRLRRNNNHITGRNAKVAAISGAKAMLKPANGRHSAADEQKVGDRQRYIRLLKQ